MSTSSSTRASGAEMSLTALILAFVAGALAVPVFHQILFLLFHLAGVLPAPFSMKPTSPFGVPEVFSSSFWGGVWGVVFALTLPKWFSGIAYWFASAIIGGVALTLVYAFIVVPLKSGGLPDNLGGLFVIGFLLNAAWGIGWALFLWAFERMRSTQARPA